MYGLFKNDYDYYEWHDLVAVSVFKENLLKKVEGEGLNLLEGEAQEKAKCNKDVHYEIHEVDEI